MIVYGIRLLFVNKLYRLIDQLPFIDNVHETSTLGSYVGEEVDHSV